MIYATVHDDIVKVLFFGAFGRVILALVNSFVKREKTNSVIHIGMRFTEIKTRDQSDL